nr:hypothetical protein [Tanacetum cinerariifolium]
LVSNDEPEAPKEAPQPPGHAPPSPNYMHGPEQPPSQDYIPGPEYPEYLVPLDDKVPIDDQPLHDDASLTALSPGYVVDSDPSEEDPEENLKKDPTDGGDDDDDDDDKKEEHLALADSITLLAVDPVPSAKDTEAFEIDESASTPLSPPTHTSPTYAEAPLGYRAAMIRFEVRESLTAPAARQPGLDVTHATDYRFVDTVDATPGRPLSKEASYGIIDVWDAMVGDMEGRAPSTLEELRQRMIDLVATLARDTHEMRYHLHTAMLLESEARDARQAWLHAMNCNRVGHDMTKEPELARDPEPQGRPTNAGNTYDLGPLREEMDEIMDLHHIFEEVLLTERGDDVASIKQHCRNLFSDDVWNLETVSGSGQLKEDLELAT